MRLNAASHAVAVRLTDAEYDLIPDVIAKLSTPHQRPMSMSDALRAGLKALHARVTTAAVTTPSPAVA